MVPPKNGFALMKIELAAQGSHGGMVCSSKCFILATMDCKQGILKHNEVELKCPKNPNNIILSIKLELARHSTFVNAIQQYFKTKQ